MNTRGELAGCRPAHPSPEAERKAGDSQSQKRATSAPRVGIPYQTASWLPVANQVFLGSWMVGIRRKGRSQRSALQKRNTAHLRRLSRCAPRKPSGWDWGGDKTPCPTWGECAHQESGGLSCSDPGRAQSSGLCGVPKNLNLSSLDLGSAYNPGPALDSSPAEQPRA